MAAAVCLVASQTTSQSTTSTSFEAISGASIPSGGGSGQLIAGHKYWISVFAQVRGNTGGHWAKVRLTHGTTPFAESEQHHASSDGTSRQPYHFQTVWTAVTDEALTLEFCTRAGQTCHADQIQIIALDLADLTENTDYYWNERATDDGLSTTPASGAAVTFTPGDAQDYFVFGYAQINHAADTTNRAQSNIVRSGEASATDILGRMEAQGTGEDVYHGYWGFRRYSLTAASNTFTESSVLSSGTAMTRLHSSVFVLRAAAFAQTAYVHTAGTFGTMSTTNYADEIQTLDITPDLTGDFLIFSHFTYESANVSRQCRWRLQVNDSDNPASQTSDAYPFNVRDGDEDRGFATGIVTELASGGARNIDLDGSVTNATGTTVANRSIAAISLELGGTANVKPDPPTFANLTNGQTGVAVDTVIDIEVADPNADDVEVEAEITDNLLGWAGGDVLVAEQADSGGTRRTVHTTPLGGLTWEGHRQIDDRMGQIWQRQNGLLSRFDVWASAFESDPTLTNGDYLATHYALDSGMRGDETLTLWAATTAYSSGAKVKRTSTANADQRYVYECTTPGTSGGSEPTWPESDGATVADGTVVWTARYGAGPANAADAADTPTPGWRARSGVTSYNPGVVDAGWKSCTFTGANMVAATPGTWEYTAIDWRPANTTGNNGLTIPMRLMVPSGHGGHVYIDGGASANNGPYVGDDMVFRAYESYLYEQHSSVSHPSRFTNLDDGGDTPPFTSGSTIRLTRPGDNLRAGVQYRIRARQRDPGGTNEWSDWTTITITTGGLVASTISSGSALYPPTLENATSDQETTGAFIASGVALHTPNLEYLVNLGTISSGVVLSPMTLTGENSVVMSSVSAGSQTFTPSLNQVVNLPAIASSVQLYAVTLTPDFTISIPNIQSAQQLFSQVLEYVVAMSNIPSGSSLGAPHITPGGASLALPTINAGSLLGGPTLSYQVSIPVIPSGASINAPLVSDGNLALVMAAIQPGSQVNSPTLEYQVVMPIIESEVQVHVPSLLAGLTLQMPSIGSALVLNVPQTEHIVGMSTILSGSSLSVPSLNPVLELQIPTIQSESALNVPSMFYDQTVVMPFISSEAVMRVPTFISVSIVKIKNGRIRIAKAINLKFRISAVRL